MLAGLCLLGLALAVCWVFSTPPRAADPLRKTAKRIASNEFNRLDDKTKLELFKAVTKNGAVSMDMRLLNPVNQRKFMEHLRPLLLAQLEQQVDEYLALPADQRSAWMDTYIAEMSKNMKIRRPPGGGMGGPPGGMPPGGQPPQGGPPPGDMQAPPGGPAGSENGKNGQPGGPGGRPPMMEPAQLAAMTAGDNQVLCAKLTTFYTDLTAKGGHPMPPMMMAPPPGGPRSPVPK